MVFVWGNADRSIIVRAEAHDLLIFKPYLSLIPSIRKRLEQNCTAFIKTSLISKANGYHFGSTGRCIYFQFPHSRFVSTPGNSSYAHHKNRNIFIFFSHLNPFSSPLPFSTFINYTILHEKTSRSDVRNIVQYCTAWCLKTTRHV